jgi:serine/threonine protein kinase
MSSPPPPLHPSTSRFKDPHRSYLSVTHAGGTPNYMAPELFNGARVDEAADVYSLACILYEAWGRRPPFAELAEGGEDKSYNVLYKVRIRV